VYLLPGMPLLLILAQIALPAPTGYVNDFAHVLDPAAVRRMEALIAEVREKTRGDIAVVTLASSRRSRSPPPRGT